MEIIKVLLTSLLSVAALFASAKIMGHKQMSQLDFFDYISGITIGSIGAELATELEKPLQPLIAIGVYGAVAILLSKITSLFPKSRKFIFRLDASKFVMPDSVVEQYSMAPVNTKQKIGIVTLLGYMLILLLPSFFTNMPGAAFINNLGVGAMSAVGLLVLAAMFTPFLCPLIQQMGGNPYVMWFLMYFSLNASFVTPAASFQSAMVHGHDRVSSKWCYITGTAYAVFTWIVLVLVTIPLANALC